ncbi:hypothetical protein [Acidithiobacillus marinus]|uniref:hypothetical protein n=1 Tax=Acidithiobacillus marinus TaxID=187490 RepID=UPI00209C0C27|nr:hypothetical protein [Acidithiobacillus marinus]
MLLCGGGLFLTGSAGAQTLEISASSVQGPGWQAQHLQASLQTDSSYTAHLQVQAGVVAMGKQRVWQKMQGHCKLQTQYGWSCSGLQLTVSGSPWGELQSDGRLQVLRSDGAGSLQLHLQGATFGHTTLRIHSGATGHWQLQARGDLALKGWVPALQMLPAKWQAGGAMHWQLTSDGKSWSRINQLHFVARLYKGQFSSPDGLQAAQNVAATLTGDGQWLRHWQGQLQLRWTQGGVLWSPWYWAAPVRPVVVHSDWQQTAEQWRLNRGRIDWPELGTARFTVSQSLHGGSMRWDLHDVDVGLEPLFAHWIKPLLPASSFAAQALLAGRLRFSVAGVPALHALRWDLQGGSFSSPPMSLQGVSSHGAWDEHSPLESAVFHWQRATLYHIPLGPVALRLALHPGGFALYHPLDIHLLGGVLHFQQLSGHWRGAHSGFAMRGDLKGLSMRSLTRIMHWPPFTGTIQATIPELTYHAGTIHTSGELSAGIFGGEVRVRDLQVQNFLGVMPLLRANVSVQGLQLKPLTEAFHFGYISGVLDGNLRHLYLLNWSPEAFQARFATVKTPGVPQKISYQAVQNITKLGGGAGIGGFFQGMFLRLFNTFSYRHLGMGVDLANGIAELSGVGTENGGFVILQGQGLPRVDIVGYNHRVSWDELLARLKTAMETGPQVHTGE